MSDHIRDACHRGTWCSRCYEGKKGRAVYPGHYGWRATPKKRRQRVAQYITKKVSGPDGTKAKTATAPAGDLGQYYPALAEWMTLTEVDGEARETLTVLIFAEGPLWKARLLNRDDDEQCFVTGRSLTELFDAVESGLIEGSLDWRKVKAWAGKK